MNGLGVWWLRLWNCSPISLFSPPEQLPLSQPLIATCPFGPFMNTKEGIWSKGAAADCWYQLGGWLAFRWAFFFRVYMLWESEQEDRWNVNHSKFGTGKIQKPHLFYLEISRLSKTVGLRGCRQSASNLLIRKTWNYKLIFICFPNGLTNSLLDTSYLCTCKQIYWKLYLYLNS